MSTYKSITKKNMTGTNLGKNWWAEIHDLRDRLQVQFIVRIDIVVGNIDHPG